MLFYQCRGEESSQAAEEGLAVVQSLPAGTELAVALLNVAVDRVDAGQNAEAFDGIAKARDLAERLGRTDIVSRALAVKGPAASTAARTESVTMRKALGWPLEAQAGAASLHPYMDLQDACVSLQRLEEAERYFSAGMAIGERRELRGTTRCLRAEHAELLLLLGKWDEAAELCAEILAIPGVAPWNQFYPLRTLGTIRGRARQTRLR